MFITLLGVIRQHADGTEVVQYLGLAKCKELQDLSCTLDVDVASCTVRQKVVDIRSGMIDTIESISESFKFLIR